jgi:hypothetical protein
MCEYCSKLDEWAHGKITIPISAELCLACSNRMLIIQVGQLTQSIRNLLDFQKEVTKKHSNWMERALNFIKREEDEIDKGEDWKK